MSDERKYEVLPGVELPDMKTIKDAGYTTQTMLVITEPLDDARPVDFINFGTKVEKGHKLTK